MKKKSKKTKRDIREILEDFIKLSEIIIKAKNENLDFYAEIEARKTQRTTCRGLKSNLKVLYFSRSYEKIAEIY